MGVVDAAGLPVAPLAVLCNFGNSDRNNKVTRAAALAELDVDLTETTLTAPKAKTSIAQETVAPAWAKERCVRV